MVVRLDTLGLYVYVYVDTRCLSLAALSLRDLEQLRRHAALQSPARRT